MANIKIIEKKQGVVSEIAENFKNSSSVVFFEYSGLSVADLTNLRRELRANGAELKVYKNTLTRRALDELKIDLSSELVGPKAVAFGNDAVMPVKLVAEFAKTNPALLIKAGIVEGEVVSLSTLNELATLPSREGLLTMLAGGLIGVVRDLSICLDLHSQNLEK